MTLYIEPIVISIRLMDRPALDETRRKYRTLASRARRRLFVLWLRNRAGALLLLASFILLFAGAALLATTGFKHWLGESGSLSMASGLVGLAIFFLVFWLFNSNPALRAIEQRWTAAEEESRDELSARLYVLSAIHQRVKELSHGPVA